MRIDMIGEAGRSELADPRNYPKNAKELCVLYTSIADTLGIEKADWVGASYGGFIATNMAIYAPERVSKVALLGPMGVTPMKGSTVFRIILATMFPIKIFQKSTMEWGIGTDLYIRENWEHWFWQILDGVYPKEAPPLTFKTAQLEKIKSPVFLILGSRDQLTGDPDKVKALAQHIPNVRIDVVDSGHFIGAEQMDFVNRELIKFLK